MTKYLIFIENDTDTFSIKLIFLVYCLNCYGNRTFDYTNIRVQYLPKSENYTLMGH